jgi:hypothetical protein
MEEPPVKYSFLLSKKGIALFGNVDKNENPYATERINPMDFVSFDVT